MTWGHSHHANPGFTSPAYTEETQIRAAVEGNNNPIVTATVTLDSTVTDPSNTPSTTVRGGTILAVKDSDGNAYVYDPDATDGTQNPVGILPEAESLLRNGVATDKRVKVVVSGVVKESELKNLDARAAAVLDRLGIKIIPEAGVSQPAGWTAFDAPIGVESKDDDYTVTAADNGKRFLATAAANFTLPTIANGLAFEFLNTADTDMIVTGDGNILAKGNAAANTLTYSTASNKIGARVRVEAQYVGGTLKWIVNEMSTCTVTVA